MRSGGRCNCFSLTCVEKEDPISCFPRKALCTWKFHVLGMFQSDSVSVLLIDGYVGDAPWRCTVFSLGSQYAPAQNGLMNCSKKELLLPGIWILFAELVSFKKKRFGKPEEIRIHSPHTSLFPRHWTFSRCSYSGFLQIVTETWFFSLHQQEGGNTCRVPDIGSMGQRGGGLKGQSSLIVDSQDWDHGTPAFSSH